MSVQRDQFTISIDKLLAECYRLLDFKAQCCHTAINSGISEALGEMAAADYNSYAAAIIDMVMSVTEDDTVSAVRTMARAKALEYDLRTDRNSGLRDS